ncbi:MAG: hypothetical protein VCA38_06005 [Roseibacillus sp.]
MLELVTPENAPRALTTPCPWATPPSFANFRDAGASIDELAGKTLLREGLLYRGGSFDRIPDSSHIGAPRTVLKLRL